MKDSIRHKLERLAERHEEVSGLLADPAVIGDTNKFRDLSVEYSKLDPVVERWRAYLGIIEERKQAREMADGDDAEMRELGQEELASLNARIEREEEELSKLLIPKDARDESNIYLEVRAGTGGDEAAIFAGDLYRMYSRYAEQQGWQSELISESPGEHGGYKEVV
ncbi:MAG: PCRF domain-containing protein, partial [Steroidobacter sp.]